MDDFWGDSRLWSIVLAGGDGERLQPLIQGWMGCARPKQYCTFIGSRSMFQHTVDRADRLCLPERRVTVIANAHREEVLTQLASRGSGKLLAQPVNRDTAAGVFLALAFIRAHHRRATVVIYPSGHFLYPEGRFARAMQAAVRTASLLPDRIVLLASPASRVEPEYGWIVTERELGWMGEHAVRAVEAFVEKPAPRLAQDLLVSGASWNTLILAARLETLWKIGWQCLPEILGLFENWSAAVGTVEEEAALEAIYQQMPARNFSSHLLQLVPHRIAAISMSGILWSDWGKPERIWEALQWIGKLPAFGEGRPCEWCKPSEEDFSLERGRHAVV